MLISIDWIKDFVDLDGIDSATLANDFTLKTAEVEDVKVTDEYLQQVICVEITEIEKHPEADNLNLVTFKTGKSSTAKVVCGASNVHVGLKVPYARNGIKLPCGIELTPKKIRGILSEGMLCSKSELALETNSSGLMVLDSSTAIGTTIGQILNKAGTTIIDVDNKSLTHRPDLWGIYGIAREFAAIYGRPLKNSFDSTFNLKIQSLIGKGSSPLKVNVDKNSAGIAYFGISVDNISVAQSPEWIQRRLISVGLRPINSIVDISNYVMLEFGIPLHIFDRNKIVGDTIYVKQVGSPISFKTLDEQERDLIATDTVVADKNGPLVLAGIMGGIDSGVTTETKNIFIEVANWKPSDVRRTSTRLGLRTDSSARYEKSLDSLMLKRTMLRTIELVLSLCPDAKIVGNLEYDGVDLTQIVTKKIHTTLSTITNTLGVKIADGKVLSILTSLGFTVTSLNQELEIEVPSYRATKDISCVADIVEEIGRMIGFDNIPHSSPKVDVIPVQLSPAMKLHRNIRNFLVQRVGALEIMTYPLVGKKLLERCSFKLNEHLELINPLSEDQDRMRPSLIPSCLEAIALNQKNFSSFTLFELGKKYLKMTSESHELVVAFYSQSQNCFQKGLNEVDKLLTALNLPFDWAKENEKFPSSVVDNCWMGLHPTEKINARIMGKFMGKLFTVHPILLKKLKIRGYLTLFTLDLSLIENQPIKEKIKYIPLTKYPSSTFDWTVAAPLNVQIEDVLTPLKKCGIKYLISAKVLDIFVREGRDTMVTLRATFQNPDETLSTSFLEEAQRQLIEVSTKAGYPLKSE